MIKFEVNTKSSNPFTVTITKIHPADITATNLLLQIIIKMFNYRMGVKNFYIMKEFFFQPRKKVFHQLLKQQLKV